MKNKKVMINKVIMNNLKNYCIATLGYIKHIFIYMLFSLLLLILIPLEVILIIYITLLSLIVLGGFLIIFLELLLLICLKLLINTLRLLLNLIPSVDKMMHGLKGRISKRVILKMILRAFIGMIVLISFKLLAMEIFHVDIYREYTSPISLGSFLLIAFLAVVVAVYIP